MKAAILFISLFLMCLTGTAQQMFSVEKLSRMVVCIADSDGTATTVLGTGTIISHDSGYYLVTAAHISGAIKNNCILIFMVENDQPATIALNAFLQERPAVWTNHKEADLSCIKLTSYDDASKNRLENHSFPYNQINQGEKAVPRDLSTVAFGFPVLDTIGTHFSPLTFNSYFSSGLLTLPRADTKAPVTFQLLENPAMQGYSGGPVVISAEKNGITYGLNQTLLVGVMHGTYADNSGGKLAMVTPSFYIRDLIK